MDRSDLSRVNLYRKCGYTVDVLDRRTVNNIFRQALQWGLVTGFRSLSSGNVRARKSNMDVLASYDTSSDDEKEGNSQKRKPATSVAKDGTSEPGMRETNMEMPEIKEESKETLPLSPSLSSKREESHQNRRYRQRSGSPADSPSKHSPASRRSSREQRRGNARSRSRSHSPKIRNSSSRSKSPNRSSERDSGQTDEFGRDLRPSHRRLSSKEKELERSHSRSPEKRESKERPRYREHRRSPGRDGREKRSSYRRDRDRDRDRRDHRDRDRRDRDRDRGRHERGRNWSDRRRSNDGGYERSRDRRISGETERDEKDNKSPEPSVAPKPPPKPVVLHLQGNRPLSSEEIQAKLAAQAEVMKSQAQQAAAALNMPSYLNPSVVNPQQYAVQAQKRKLLWSTKKKETPTAAWNATSFTNDTSGEVQAKFRRLMGIKEGEAEKQGANPNTENLNTQSKQLMDDLQNEFERSRAFQLSRGAGGKSGIGLGYTGM